MDWNHDGKRDAFDRAMDLQINEDIERELREGSRGNQHTEGQREYRDDQSWIYVYIRSFAEAIRKITPLVIIILIITSIIKIIEGFMDSFLTGILTLLIYLALAIGIVLLIIYIARKIERKSGGK